MAFDLGVQHFPQVAKLGFAEERSLFCIRFETWKFSSRFSSCIALGSNRTLVPASTKVRANSSCRRRCELSLNVIALRDAATDRGPDVEFVVDAP